MAFDPSIMYLSCPVIPCRRLGLVRYAMHVFARGEDKDFRIPMKVFIRY